MGCPGTEGGGSVPGVHFLHFVVGGGGEDPGCVVEFVGLLELVCYVLLLLVVVLQWEGVNKAGYTQSAGPEREQT